MSVTSRHDWLLSKWKSNFVQEYLSLLSNYLVHILDDNSHRSGFAPKRGQAKLSDVRKSLLLLDLFEPGDSGSTTDSQSLCGDHSSSWTYKIDQMERPVKVTPASGCVESHIFVDLLAEHMSAYSQTREDNLTSPLISPPSCLFSFSFLSISPLSPLCSFLLSCPTSASGGLLPCLSYILFIWVNYLVFCYDETPCPSLPCMVQEHWLSSSPPTHQP